VKPEMVPTFEDLRKNVLVPALKKAGLPWYSTWASVTGRINTRLSVEPFTEYTAFDQAPAGLTSATQRALGPDGWQIYLAKLRPTQVSSQAVIQTVRQDLTIASNSNTPPVLAAIRIVQLLPGKGDEFTRFMTSEYLPALKKAGEKEHWVYATNFGAPQGSFVFVRPRSNYADFETGGPLAALGTEAVPINAKLNAMISSSEVNIYRFMPDLSFGTAATPRTTK